jgi:hypothetical protein
MQLVRPEVEAEGVLLSSSVMGHLVIIISVLVIILLERGLMSS